MLDLSYALGFAGKPHETSDRYHSVVMRVNSRQKAIKYLQQNPMQK